MIGLLGWCHFLWLVLQWYKLIDESIDRTCEHIARKSICFSLDLAMLLWQLRRAVDLVPLFHPRRTVDGGSQVTDPHRVIELALANRLIE